MARRRSSLRELPGDEPDDDEPIDEPSRGRGRPARPRRRRWRFPLSLLAIVGLAIAAPMLVGKATPLRNSLLGSVLPAAAGRLAAADASFSWFGSQSLGGITLVDAAGQPIFAAESLTVHRSLIGLATNRRHFGKMVLVRPVIYLGTRPNASNLEDFLQRLAEATSEPADPQQPASMRPTIAEIEIVEGSVLGRDAASGQWWRVEGLALTARPIENTDQWDVAGAGVLALTEAAAPTAVVPVAAGQRPAGAPPNDEAPVAGAGRFKFHLFGLEVASAGTAERAGASPPPAPPAPPARWQLELIADRLPLAPLEPWLARAVAGARITGLASADLKAAWQAPPSPTADAPASNAPPTEILAVGKLDAADVRFTSAALRGDLLELPTAAVAVDARMTGGRLSAKQFSARSPWLEAEFAGDLDAAKLKQFSMASLPATDASLTARVDLPQLTRMLPRTLQLRPGVRIDSGSVEITARSTSADDGASRGVPAPGAPANYRRWTIAAAVENLIGTDGQRPIAWEQPIELGLDAVAGSDGPQLTRAIVRAPFATATADTVDEGLHGRLQFNLDELAAQLGQFVDLSAWTLHGTGKGEFTLRDTGPESFVATSELQLANIDVRRDGNVVWIDPELRLELQANGRRRGLWPEQIDAATAFMRGPRDVLSIELQEPIDLRAVGSEWFFKVSGNGPLDSWAGRLRPWIAAVPNELAGQSKVHAEIRARRGFVHVTQSQVSVENLRTVVAGKEILEPQVQASGDFRWDAATREIESQSLTFTSTTVAATARGLSLEWIDAGPPTVRGEVAFRGDFERVAAWLGLVDVEGGMWPRGQGVGRLLLASDARQATAKLTLKAEPLQLVRAASRGQPGLEGESIAWNEPRLEFATEAVYTTADDRLQLADLRLQGTTVQVAGSGAVEQFRTAGVVRGDVNVTYDAGELGSLLAGYLGPGVDFQGANQARLQVTGRLRNEASRGVPAPGPSAAHWSRRWQVAVDAGWSAANLYGLPIGAAQLNANLRDGEVLINPLDLAVGPGRIALQPRVLLDPAPQQLQLASGQLISKVAISAEVSERMLKYAAPIIAGATRADGSFSFFLSQPAQIPLRQPKQSRLEGRLTIHQLAVVPGPMIQDIANLIRQVETLSKNGQGLGRGLGGLLGGAAAPEHQAPTLKGVTMNERTIDVQVIDGRVYHRNLEFFIDDVPVRSQGSVGFDETLALLIEVPIQAKWVGDNPALQPLVGQALRIPVEGTFGKPKFDQRAIGAFVAQAAQSAAGGLIGGELNKALDKLLRPK